MYAGVFANFFASSTVQPIATYRAHDNSRSQDIFRSIFSFVQSFSTFVFYYRYTFNFIMSRDNNETVTVSPALLQDNYNRINVQIKLAVWLAIFLLVWYNTITIGKSLAGQQCYICHQNLMSGQVNYDLLLLIGSAFTWSSMMVSTLPLYQQPSSENWAAQRSPGLKKTGVGGSFWQCCCSFSTISRNSGSSEEASWTQKVPLAERGMVTYTWISAPEWFIKKWWTLTSST